MEHGVTCATNIVAIFYQRRAREQQHRGGRCGQRDLTLDAPQPPALRPNVHTVSKQQDAKKHTEGMEERTNETED